VALETMVSLIGKKEELDRLLRSLCIDSSKIRKVLNWKPPFSMKDGINETVKAYKKSSKFNVQRSKFIK